MPTVLSKPAEDSERTVYDELVDRIHALINVEGESKIRNPDFKIVLGPRGQFDAIADATGLSLTDDVEFMLSSPLPPSVKSLLSLPAPQPGTCGICVVIMEKDGCVRIYIGSGTSALAGVTGRPSVYRNDTTTELPTEVQKAFDEGFIFLHVGMLASSPIAPTGIVPRARAFLLATESMFTHMLHALGPSSIEHYIDHLRLWLRGTVEWEPLCSHRCISVRIFLF